MNTPAGSRPAINSATTPLMRQYLEVKSRHEDSLVFFRMDDFYELFFDDAIKASKLLEIALTARNKNDENPVPMCGVPHHSATNYIHRLVALGHKVAICEQLESPAEVKAQGKEIVKRDVVRIISPGTRLDPEALDSKAHNFTLAAKQIDDKIYWSTCDYTTGNFYLGVSQDLQAWLGVLQQIAPSEILLADDTWGVETLETLKRNFSHVYAQTVSSFYFETTYAKERLQEQFETKSLKSVHPELASRPETSGALVKYFQETQKLSKIPSVVKAEFWGSASTMSLDISTIKALELLPTHKYSAVADSNYSRDISLLSFIDRTKTSMGARLLRDWVLHPLTKKEDILSRQEQVISLKNDISDLQSTLNQIYDLERLLSRVCLAIGSNTSARELHQISRSILFSKELSDKIFQIKKPHSPQIQVDSALLSLAQKTLAALNDELPPTVREGGMFKKGFHAALDELIELSENGAQWLAEFEAREKKTTSINSLKVRFNRVFGYYIEITKANLTSVPAHYIRKQTMVGGERYITEELKTFEEKILTAEKKRNDLEYSLFKDFCAEFSNLSVVIQTLASQVAQVDALVSLSDLSHEEGYVLPEIHEGTALEINEGRHPTVSLLLSQQRPPVHFVPNSLTFTESQPFLIITGPNMGGKSTVMRQTALIMLMAQMGSYVPAASARIGIADRIFTRIGAHDNTAEGSSTFMVEMSEMSFILRNASAKSLILIDEIGRGTSTYDGMSLAWALASDIANRIGARTLFATHYHELTRLADTHSQIANTRVAVKIENGQAIFTHRLEAGIAERSYGILVAKLAGLPADVLRAAQSMLTRLEAQARSPKPAPDIAQLKLLLDSPSSEPAAPTKPSELEIWLKNLKLNEMTPLQALTELSKQQSRL